VASAAAIASGALARAGRAAQRAEADAIDAALNRALPQRQGGRKAFQPARCAWQQRGPMALPVIEDALRDPGNPARPAAARALRLAEGPEVDGLLSGAITGDNDPHVRSGAVLCCQLSPSDRFGSGRSAGARRQRRPGPARAKLRHQSASSEPWRLCPDCGTLKWISENDTEPGIRRLAEEALKSFSGGPAR